MRTGLAVLAVVISSAAASATTFTVPLDGLVGVYSDNGVLAPRDKNISFDFGYGFSRIDSVQIQIRGTVAPGLWSAPDDYGLSQVPMTISVYPGLSFSVHAPGVQVPPLGTVSLSIPRASLAPEGAFDRVLMFELMTNPITGEMLANWDFLKIGHAELDLQVGQGLPDGYVQLIPGLAGISEANLILQGTAVPEPTGPSLLISALSGAFLLRRCRRS